MYAETRRAYLQDQLTRDEVAEAFIKQGYTADSARIPLEDWDLIKGLQAELAATRKMQQAPHLGNAVAVELIDHAYLTGHIQRFTTERYLLATGVLPEVTVNHLDCLDRERNHDAQRNAYLDDPEHAPRYCTRCGKQTPRQKLSTRGICKRCSTSAWYQSSEQIIAREGPYYERWRDGILSAIVTQDLLHPVESRLQVIAVDEPTIEVYESFDEPDDYDYDEYDRDNDAWECENCSALNHPDDDICYKCGWTG